MILTDLFETAAIALDRPFGQALDEMAPTEEMLGQRFYHGTPTTAAAASIMKTGLRPGHEVQKRGHLDPVAGRTYMTPDLRYAVVYAIGGNMLGQELPPQWIGQSRYGYVFVIDGASLNDVQPDEDSVGAFIGDYAAYPKRDYGDGRLLSDRSKPPTFACDSSDPDYAAKRTAWHEIKSLMTPTQFARSCDGIVASQAAGGKRVMAKLSDGTKANLIRWGAHVAAAGAYTPTECWRIDKTKCARLAKDGSNFFQIAQKMQRVRA